jgi:hypothetical protein
MRLDVNYYAIFLLQNCVGVYRSSSAIWLTDGTSIDVRGHQMTDESDFKWKFLHQLLDGNERNDIMVLFSNMATDVVIMRDQMPLSHPPWHGRYLLFLQSRC